MKQLAGEPQTNPQRPSRDQASSRSNASRRQRSERDTARCGRHPDPEGLYKAPSVPPSFEAFAILGLNRIWHRNALALYTKYLHFLKVFRKPSA